LLFALTDAGAAAAAAAALARDTGCVGVCSAVSQRHWSVYSVKIGP